MNTASAHTVRHFREVLFWPVQLMPVGLHGRVAAYWEVLEHPSDNNPWRKVEDVFRLDSSEFEERHYKEFVTFLPYVQRFIYGESHRHHAVEDDDALGESAMKRFRRYDVFGLRLMLREGDAPLVLEVENVELLFFDDIHVAFLKVELSAKNMPFEQACDLLYRFGRAYPTGWDSKGNSKHNVHHAEWLDDNGAVLARSDSHDQAKFLNYTREHRSPSIAAHWDFLLRPLVLDPSKAEGTLRYRQIEYHRMPLMAFLSLENPRTLTRSQWQKLGFIATLHPDDALPAHDPDVAEFETRYCYDRFWSNSDTGTNTRFICTGRAFVVVGDAQNDYFHDAMHGILAQFRHQYLLLFLIVHFHRAALLVFSDRLVDAVHDLDIRLPQSIHRFRRRIYAGFEAFLRFTHRYWFHELSERTHIQALYRLSSTHLGNEHLYQEVKEELRDMSQYLDSNAQRQQSTTIMRLTVVSTFSMVGTVTTGLLGMNLIAAADASLSIRSVYFLGTVALTTFFMVLAILKSKQLSDVMDVLADDQKSLSNRLATMGTAWRRKY